jgi:hypothetical protein
MGSEIDEGEGWLMATRATFRPLLIALLLALLAQGCANDGTATDSGKRGGFYGGVSGAGTWP